VLLKARGAGTSSYLELICEDPAAHELAAELAMSGQLRNRGQSASEQPPLCDEDENEERIPP
jgi:hypothetical protein